MLSKKTITWLLTVGLLASGSLYLWKRHQRKAQKAAAALAASSKESAPSEEEDEDKKQPPPPPKPKETVLSLLTRQHLAEKEFIRELRAAFHWRSTQSAGEVTDRQWLEKIRAIPASGLPPERQKAWQTLLSAWKALQNPAQAPDPKLHERGQKAAATLNAMFQQHGEGDLTL